MQGFTRVPLGYIACLEGRERRLLIALIEELIAVIDAPFLDPGFVDAVLGDPTPTLPSNPVLAALLPDLSADPDIADQLRSLSEDELRVHKTRTLKLMANQLAANIRTPALDCALSAPQAAHYGNPSRAEGRCQCEDMGLSSQLLLIAHEDVSTWLAGLEDLRRALAVTIDDCHTNPQVYQRLVAVTRRFLGPVRWLAASHCEHAKVVRLAVESHHTSDKKYPAVTGLYHLLTWWQGSLLAAAAPGDKKATLGNDE